MTIMTVTDPYNSETLLRHSSAFGLARFLKESLAIENIHRDPAAAGIKATHRFLEAPLTADTVIALQEVYAPGKPLRNKPGMDVRVERYYPPRGAADMKDQLADYADPFHGLVAFEKRHPFMGGNGRVNHAVWVSLMQAIGRDPFGLGFLHRLYCQVLDAAD